MSWQTITTSSILTALSKAEFDRYNTTSTGSMYTSASLMQELINDTIAEVRSYIMGCPRNMLSTDETLIPSSCVTKAKQIIVYNLMSRVAGKISDVNGSRKDEFDKAYEFLSKISKGDIGIDLPDNPIVIGQFNQFYGNSSNPIKY